MEVATPIRTGILTVNRKRTKSPGQRLRAMHDRLVKAYGPQFWWPAKSPFEVILGAYLTQNTSWKAVEVSLANLRRANALNIKGIRALTDKELQELIRPSGFPTRKGPAIKAFVALLDSEFDGSLERLAAAPTKGLRRRFLALAGVGDETADAILLYALKHPIPMADEYLRRIAVRHQLIQPAPGRNRNGYEGLVQLTREAFSADAPGDRVQLFNEFHALSVAVGKAHCRRTPDCRRCPLAGDLLEQTKRAHSGLE
jgi:endonuclease III related protein